MGVLLTSSPHSNKLQGHTRSPLRVFTYVLPSSLPLDDWESSAREKMVESWQQPSGDGEKCGFLQQMDAVGGQMASSELDLLTLRSVLPLLVLS